MLEPKFNPEFLDIVSMFISERCRIAGGKGVVLGLSGGLDSAVVAKLCADCLGPEKVLALVMPVKSTGKGNEGDAARFAETLGIECRTVEIANSLEALRVAAGIPDNDRASIGNIQARARMVILYANAKRLGRLVMGTSNKSELLVGYFTKFGDGGSDLNPLGDLYKTQVWELARLIGVPSYIIDKKPTADLWEGQTDEGELGMSYRSLDMILTGLELRMTADTIAERTGFALKDVEGVIKLVRGSIHKRKLAKIPKIGYRTVGLDWRE